MNTNHLLKLLADVIEIQTYAVDLANELRIGLPDAMFDEDAPDLRGVAEDLSAELASLGRFLDALGDAIRKIPPSCRALDMLRALDAYRRAHAVPNLTDR